MSADEDTELRDLVAQTLESNGVLGKIRAELRASVFLTLEEQESVQNKTPFLNAELKKFLITKEGRLVAGLVQEFLEHFNLEFTQAVFEPESGVKSVYDGRESLAHELNLHVDATIGDNNKQPLLKELVTRLQGEKTNRSGFDTSVPCSGDWNIPEDLSPKQIEDARKKFEYYDKDQNGTIDKDELRSLFTDIFPGFHRNMLERYVNDEFRAVDRDFSNSYLTLTVTEPGIDFEEFLNMYRRLFIQCRSVVAGDVSDLVPQRSTKDSPLSSSSHKGTSNHVGSKGGRGWDEPAGDSQHSSKGQMKPAVDPYSSDVEDDPFFDDPVPVSNTAGLQAISSTSQSKPDDKVQNKSDHNEVDLLGDLPPLPTSKPPELPSRQSQENDSRGKDNSGSLRPLDKRMSDMDLSDMGGDFDIEYEDDFLSTQSLSQKSPRTLSKSDHRSQNENGSIAEEIEEEIDDISIEADDLLKSQNSAFDDLTTDRTISQHDTGFDYAEDIQLP
ncbi:centrosomal protein 43-like isoform X2 [Liolophura sinensis]|uniref:centrosomal protein 43-like isoform X2 n=1 Tax=Liolophura sinensis TaxID=3198878 RepID=UPI003157FDE1